MRGDPDRWPACPPPSPPASGNLRQTTARRKEHPSLKAVRLKPAIFPTFSTLNQSSEALQEKSGLMRRAPLLKGVRDLLRGQAGPLSQESSPSCHACRCAPSVRSA
ncbi:hypothetical protein SKAU_G00364710 [Synaphobranchus kaupii]|uniref:Uncharacterized protein n=1 Tax=Synaphobranchus kaupii TaxID=118154 RepID=A0A9Q1EEU5_SYNKA|nr:hypothetical protein SKAU_G00364710 [Synaphobranchus kaupii]